MIRVLLLGKNGQLGWELHRTLAPLGKIIALDFPEIDLSEYHDIHRIVQEAQPQVVVNATAYTDVDRAENQPEIAFAINSLAPGYLAEAVSNVNAALIHYSTDYVFDGFKGSAYTESDNPNPLNLYGQSKLEGEQAIMQTDAAYLILRTSWLYSMRRDSFLSKVLKWSQQDKAIRVVTDQIGNPTWVRMLAEAVAQLLAIGGKDIVGWIRERKGIYHLAGDGYASRFQWAKKIIHYDPNREGQISKEIQPALTAEFPTPAQRPLFSALNCELFTATFGLRLPAWEYALTLALKEL